MVKKYIMTKISTTKPIINAVLVHEVPVVVSVPVVPVDVGRQLTNNEVAVINPIIRPIINSFDLCKLLLLINANAPEMTRDRCALYLV